MQLDSLKRMLALIRETGSQHPADIGVLKSDFMNVRGRAPIEAALEPLRGFLPTVDLEALRQLPEATFGNAYARFLDNHGLSVFVLTHHVPAEVRERQTYGIRLATTHDMLHVLLGFGPDWPGEMGVLAFTWSQGYSTALLPQLIAAWLIYPVRAGFAYGEVYRAYRRGVELGERAPMLLGIRLSELLDHDLEQVRSSLGLGESS